MNIIFENLYKDYEGKLVFKNITGRINKGDKIGLIGSNGVGKTTFAKIIAGLENFEKGKLIFSINNGKIVYLSQSFMEEGGSTIIDQLNQGSSSNSLEALKVIASTNKSMYAEGFDGGSFNADLETRKLLTEMGIPEESWNQPVNTLSGGEKTKLMLAKVLVQDFDLLILDEPTNHLDIESRYLLEKLVNRFKKTVLIISHDRYFIDKVVTKVWEMNPKEIKEYSGNYTNYKIQKEIELKNNLKEYEKQQRAIEGLRENINDRKDWFIKAHDAAGQNDFARSRAKKHIAVLRSKEKQLKRLEENKVERPKEEMSPCFHIINKSIINTKLPKFLIQVKKLSKSFGDKVLFQDISFDILRGDKAVVLGSNGTGKTTLLNIINNMDSDFKGSLSINPSVKIAFFSQQLEVLNFAKCILDNVLCEGITQTEARLLLANLFFKGEDVFKSVSVLSMGEKCRVAIAKLILSGANFLILDEPTNYMDIVAKEKIEEVLKEFRGSILFVSHDRYFINSVANKIIEIENKNIKLYNGNYEFYIRRKEDNTLEKATGNQYISITETITKLECQLAFIGGRLNEKLQEEEKAALNEEFIKTARELREFKEKLQK